MSMGFAHQGESVATPRPGAQQRRRRVSDAVQAPTLDFQLIAIVATFLLLGLVMVLSASFPLSGTHFFQRQLVWVAMGVLVLAVMAAIPHRFWKLAALPLMLTTLVGLVAVLVIGQLVFGAQRTLLGGRFQPSELAKLAVAVYVAAWVAARGKKVATLQDGMLPFLIIMGLVAGLIAAERSFSVTLIVLAIGLTIYFVGGGSTKQLLVLFAIAAPLLLLAMWRAGYPWERIQGWYNVWFNQGDAPEDLLRLTNMLREGRGSVADPAIWHIKASVPGLWSDYLFANIGADLHIVGTLAVLGLYVWFGYRGLGIALNAPDSFGALTAIGLTAWILIQAAVHIGTSLTLIPATGQPLPFMSYGGSSLISSMAAAGLLLSISRASTSKKAPYAHLALGGRDWWPRVSGSGRRQRAEDHAKKRARTVNRRRHTTRQTSPHGTRGRT